MPGSTKVRRAQCLWLMVALAPHGSPSCPHLLLLRVRTAANPSHIQASYVPKWAPPYPQHYPEAPTLDLGLRWLVQVWEGHQQPLPLLQLLQLPLQLRDSQLQVCSHLFQVLFLLLQALQQFLGDKEKLRPGSTPPWGHRQGPETSTMLELLRDEDCLPSHPTPLHLLGL